MKIPAQLPPILRTISPIHEATETRPSYSLRRLLSLGRGRPGSCLVWFIHA